MKSYIPASGEKRCNDVEIMLSSSYVPAWINLNIKLLKIHLMTDNRTRSVVTETNCLRKEGIELPKRFKESSGFVCVFFGVFFLKIWMCYE